MPDPWRQFPAAKGFESSAGQRHSQDDGYSLAGETQPVMTAGLADWDSLASKKRDSLAVRGYPYVVVSYDVAV